MKTTIDGATKKRVIASRLRKLADDMSDIAERMDEFKEDKEWSLYLSELMGSSEIVNEWADEIESTIK
jgi:hypothetical protein